MKEGPKFLLRVRTFSWRRRIRREICVFLNRNMFLVSMCNVFCWIYFVAMNRKQGGFEQNRAFEMKQTMSGKIHF